jgi:hypothetical protein
MKRKLFLFSFILLSLGFNYLQAQNTIVDDLQSNGSTSDGIIEIETDTQITELIGKPNEQVKVDTNNYDIIKINGFRIQIYMGNDPKRSRGEVFEKQTKIRETHSDVETYVSYEAPNWKLLVGDFTTRDEAILFKEVLRKEFPQFGKEMYVVTSIINVSVEK